MHTSSLRGLVVAIALALAGCGAKAPEDRIKTARQALQQSDYKTAEIELKSALQELPAHGEARLLLAETLQALGRWADSEKELRKAQDRGANAEQVLPLLARALVKLGKYQQAADITAPASGMGSQALASLQAERASAYMAMEKAGDAAQTIQEGQAALDRSGGQAPISKDLQLAKAKLAVIKNQPAEGLAILDDTIQRYGKFIPAYYLKAQILLQQAKMPEAIKVYEQIIAIKGNEVIAHLAIADNKLRLNDITGADKALQAAEKLNTGMPFAKYMRAKVAVAKGDLKTARDALLQVLRGAPDHLPSIMLDAVVNYGLGNYEQSLKSASKVLGQAPGNYYATKLVAANELRRGNAQLVITSLVPLVQTQSDDAQVLTMLGEAHMQLKQHDKALAYLEKAAKLQPRNPSIKSYQAQAHLAEGRADLALAELDAAAAMTVQPSQADMGLVMLYMARKEFDKALKAIAGLEKKLPNDPITHYLRGLALEGKADRAGARKAFEQALSLKPGYYQAASQLARMDVADKRPDQARQRMQAVLKVDEKNVEAMMALSGLAASDNNEQEALRWMTKAASTDPKAVAPRASLVRYHLTQKSTGKALAIAREAVDANPDNAEALGLLAMTQMASGDQPSALSSYAKAVEKSPGSAITHYQFGVAQIAAGRREDGRRSLEKALSLDPGHGGALNALTMADMADKQLDKALSRTRAFQAKNPKSPLGFTREADLLMAQKRYQDSARLYEKAFQIGDGLTDLAKLQGALIRSDKLDQANRKMAEVLGRYPKGLNVLTYAGDYYLRTGQYRESVRTYEAALKIKPDDPAILNNLALLYQGLEDKRALQTAEQAYKLGPEHPGILDTLGWILVEQGQIPRGLDLLRQARAKAPDAPTVRYHLAVALVKAGNKAEAKRELESLLKTGQKFKDLDNARSLLASL